MNTFYEYWFIPCWRLKTKFCKMSQQQQQQNSKLRSARAWPFLTMIFKGLQFLYVEYGQFFNILLWWVGYTGSFSMLSCSIWNVLFKMKSNKDFLSTLSKEPYILFNFQLFKKYMFLMKFWQILSFSEQFQYLDMIRYQITLVIFSPHIRR